MSCAAVISIYKKKKKKGRERQSVSLFYAPPKIPQNAKTQTSIFHSAVVLLANTFRLLACVTLAAEAASQASREAVLCVYGREGVRECAYVYV